MFDDGFVGVLTGVRILCTASLAMILLVYAFAVGGYMKTKLKMTAIAGILTLVIGQSCFLLVGASWLGPTACQAVPVTKDICTIEPRYNGWGTIYVRGITSWCLYGTDCTVEPLIVTSQGPAISGPIRQVVSKQDLPHPPCNTLSECHLLYLIQCKTLYNISFVYSCSAG